VGSIPIIRLWKNANTNGASRLACQSTFTLASNARKKLEIQMSKLQNAIDYIQSRIDKRTCAYKPYDNRGATVLVLEEAEHVLSLLRTHFAEEDALQFDMEMTERSRRIV
jgi:hypothetical protein